MTRLALPLLVFGAAAALAYAPAPLAPMPDRPVAPADSEWTWPVHPQNLQVLPGDIGPDGLRRVMQSFTRALGVRCGHCHVGEGDFLNWDFASDANRHKDIARQMMRMTSAINTAWLASTEGLHNPVDPALGAAGFRVTCWTCHRGQAEPEVRAPARDAAPAPAPAPEHGEHGHDGHPHGDGQPHRHDGH